MILGHGLSIIGMWDKQGGISIHRGVLPVILLIRKRQMIFILLFCVFLAGLAAVLWHGNAAYTAVFAARDGVPVTVVIDPGHGGEDGGAVSSGGVAESRINLAIALRVNDLMRFSGQRTVMTRSEEISIHTEGDTMRARKVSDIHHRVDIVNSTENAVLVSIHQNSLPSSPVTHGAQAFWNQQEGAEELAVSVQEALNSAINTEKAKVPKRIPSTIYLMKHVTAPSVLVECGFLSNTEETRLLQEPSHQLRLAAAITAGCLACGAGEEGS
ncbi:N-acetylmuramoyl-L-alanine amidase [Oscillibacter sp. PC13]|nr:N-acetylmuramoyl-L-alanine amidase [Oscillibacter sp. PC13]